MSHPQFQCRLPERRDDNWKTIKRRIQSKHRDQMTDFISVQLSVGCVKHGWSPEPHPWRPLILVTVKNPAATSSSSVYPPVGTGKALSRQSSQETVGKTVSWVTVKDAVTTLWSSELIFALRKEAHVGLAFPLLLVRFELVNSYEHGPLDVLFGKLPIFSTEFFCLFFSFLSF